MAKTYVTFGQVHTHSINGKTFDKDCVAVIECNDRVQGRQKAFELFNGVFAIEYYEDAWKEDEMLPYFPRGYINVDGAKAND